MSENHHLGHLLKGAVGVTDDLEPLESVKSPVVAAICGFALGGIGLSLYTRSWQDLLIPFCMLFFIAILAIPTGETLVVLAPFFWAYYGYRRVKSSNEQLGV